MASTAKALSRCLPSKSLDLSAAQAVLQSVQTCSVPAVIRRPSVVPRAFLSSCGQRWFRKCDRCTPAGRSRDLVSAFGFSRGNSNFVTMAAATDQAGEQVLEQDAVAEAMERVQEHQKTAAQLPPVEEARTILDICRQGLLSVHSSRHEGYPMGSLVGYATDEAGSPILAISSLSPHTQDLERNPQCSFFLSRDLNSMNRAKVTLLGNAEIVDEAERQSVRDSYLKKHPNAFWVDFGDFRFVRIRPTHIRMTRNIATFAMGASVTQFTPEDFAAAEPDPIAQFEKPIMDHMNADHADALMATVEHYVGTPKLDGAQMLELDRLGMRLQVKQGGSSFALRVPFTRPAADRGDVKTLLVEMTRESMKALGRSRGGPSQQAASPEKA
ncbi:FMN binding protein [Klebsormidium nitens]|uniref:FMN binding protein n=1 Tax=Klebsormidium nitens TaxID=105231 RepID=A0A1Y1HPH6_KLENI|nr:FMN binding protein [Klebsormidium nitens]|eukprot:GAQ79682.1 FMN binding protein [Klebsormidium nitens]